MRIFILFQDKTFVHERIGGYIWAPEKYYSDIGKYNFENIKRMNKGDVVYSILDDKIVSVSIVTSQPERKKKPIDLDIPAAGMGWYVSVNYSLLKREILLSIAHKKEISSLSVEREVPYDEDGNQMEGLLFEIPYEAHKYIMNLVSTYNFTNKFDLPELKNEDVVLIHQLEHMVEKYDSKEQKALVIRMGILETILKQRLMRHTKKCAVCDIDYSEFLSAVYCKPWDDSSTSERLDLNNLLLLCPLHRELFEKGFITFNDKGMIKISEQMKFENFKSLSINLFTSINLTDAQIKYMEWHNKNVFKK
ncbi:MAG: HNH endonuclease [Eubacteriales bacterium]